jgi:hypothetical protein
MAQDWAEQDYSYTRERTTSWTILAHQRLLLISMAPVELPYIYRDTVTLILIGRGAVVRCFATLRRCKCLPGEALS